MNGNWQTIDTAPKDGSTILLYDPSFGTPWRQFVPARWLEETGQFESGKYTHTKATHWIALPAPPSGIEPETNSSN